MRREALIGACLALAAGTGSGCTDPVRDQQIAALGDDTEPPGPDHRAGQPCLLCHSDGGPASSKAFAIAGTVWASASPGAKGKEGIVVQFIDARGGAPAQPAETGPSGNFYVPIADWPNIAFPIRTALYRSDSDIDSAPITKMNSLINREGSCNFCHRTNIDPDDYDDDDAKKKAIESTTSSAGQIYVP